MSYAVEPLILVTGCLRALRHMQQQGLYVRDGYDYDGDDS